MVWNWELLDWPKFTYDRNQLALYDRDFLLNSERFLSHVETMDDEERKQFLVEILSLEGEKSSKIEGEILNKKSIQQALRKHFGFDEIREKDSKENRTAKILCFEYETYSQPLSHEMLYELHSMLFEGTSEIEKGMYRTHEDPMQIISSRYGSPTVFFEAPPSNSVFHEMTAFIDWFNAPRESESLLGRAAIAHIYFESIHPFEDGNGRIGRLLSEKMISQGVHRPILLAVSKMLEKHRKEYYQALEMCNKTLHVQPFVEFFAKMVVESQEESMKLLYFLLEKAKLFASLHGKINPRQEKALLRMFEEGPSGFHGGLSAENYIAITKASRATASRDLLDLVEKKALRKTGELRYTRYWLYCIKDF